MGNRSNREPIVHQLAQVATSERTRNQISSLIKREDHDYYENLAFSNEISSPAMLLREVDSLLMKICRNASIETCAASFSSRSQKFYRGALTLRWGARRADVMVNRAPTSSND
jgi:hypothetical protein